MSSAESFLATDDAFDYWPSDSNSSPWVDITPQNSSPFSFEDQSPPQQTIFTPEDSNHEIQTTSLLPTSTLPAWDYHYLGETENFSTMNLESVQLPISTNPCPHDSTAASSADPQGAPDFLLDQAYGQVSVFPWTTAGTQMDLNESGSSSSGAIDSPGQWASHRALPILPPPPGFGHTKIALKEDMPDQRLQLPVEWQEALHVELKKETKLAELAAGDLPLRKSQSTLHNQPTSHQSKRRCIRGTPVAENMELIRPSSTQSSISSSNTFQQVNRADESLSLAPGSETVSPHIEKKSTQTRQAVARIRKKGACLRCWLNREKCSESTPCKRCIRVVNSSRTMYFVPCQRSKLDDIELFRRRTQFGLFVYDYEGQLDNISNRTVTIVDPTRFQAQDHSQPTLSLRTEISVDGSSNFQQLLPHGPRDETDINTSETFGHAQLERGIVVDRYLDKHMANVIAVLGTSHQFIAYTLETAKTFSERPPEQANSRKMLRNALRIFTARFLRRKYWIRIDDSTRRYSVAWMDAPWKALPADVPRSEEEEEYLNKILKDHLFLLENSVLKSFKSKVYGRKKEDWFELFLVTFIFQVVLSENLEMSFHSKVDGFYELFELPWSTFGGLRSYSSRKIAAHFRAINGNDPFRIKTREGTIWDGFGPIETAYLQCCSGLLKRSLRDKADLGTRRSSSVGHDGTPGSWWQWALDTVLGTEGTD